MTRILMVGMVLGALLLVGCGGKNVPCDTDPSQIAGAQAELQSAQQGVSSAESELAAAQNRRTTLNNQMNSLPEPAELEAELMELKKGSGR